MANADGGGARFELTLPPTLTVPVARTPDRFAVLSPTTGAVRSYRVTPPTVVEVKLLLTHEEIWLAVPLLPPPGPPPPNPPLMK